VTLRGDFYLNDWLVQPQLNLVSRSGKNAHIEPKAMQVLLQLAGRPDEVVSKATLKKEVWADTYVTDDVLVRCISELRKALEDDPKNPEVIQTIPRGGYRLIAPVLYPEETVHDPTPGEPELSQEAGEQSRPAAAARPGRSYRFEAPLGGAILLLGLLALAWGSGFWPFGSSLPVIKSLAVLPLENLSGDAEQDYFADAMTEALISDLANVETLQVASRTSVVRFKSTTLPVSAIAKQLGVDALVEGSVVPIGDRVRISALLIDGRTDRHLWSGTYEREYSDVLFLQKEVARAVAEEIRSTLTPREKQRLTKARSIAPKAYEAYVKGRYFWNQRTPEALAKAAASFEEAIAVDPEFGLAYSGLADTFSLLAHYGFRDAGEAFPKSKEAALKALELDASAAEPHASLALASMSFDRDWGAAEAGFRKAIDLNPSYATAHHWLALCLMGQGQTKEAIREALRARELDPVSLAANTFLAQCFLWAGQYNQGVKECLVALELHPDAATPRVILAECYWRLGRTNDALAQLDRVRENWRDDPRQLTITRALIAGDRDRAAHVFKDYLSDAGESADAMFSAQALALIGEKDQAYKWLDRALARHNSGLLILKVDPTFDGLRGDPRFQSLLSRLGLD
jgi:TolB-like protein/DNA-binding winged helix-turn-helix (wHTH) protein/Tfp pilus assembly protein PilF